MKKLIAGLIGAGVVLGMSPAFAGEWRLDPRRCPDLVEDRYDRAENRRDERYDYSRRDVREDRADRREDRRDRSVTVCPRSAFYYQADRGERGHRRPALRFTYDRSVGLSYRNWNGARIYVRA